MGDRGFPDFPYMYWKQCAPFIPAMLCLHSLYGRREGFLARGV